MSEHGKDALSIPLLQDRMPPTLHFHVALFVAFLFILPIPGTIALRHVLMAVLAVTMATLFRRHRIGIGSWGQPARRLALAFGAMTAWLLIQAFVISNESDWAFREIRGQWLPAVVAAVLAAGSIRLCHRLGYTRETILAGVTAVFLAQTAFCLIVCIPQFLDAGAFPQVKTTWTAGKLEISFWNNLVLAFLVVDGLGRWLYRRPLTALSVNWVIAGIVLVLVSNLAFGARNGVIGSLMLLSSVGVLIAWRERRRIGGAKAIATVTGVLLLIAAVAIANFSLDPRWALFLQSANMGWQIDTYHAWQGESQYVASGLEARGLIDESAYLRISWIRAGLEMIGQYPLGVGYGRNAFGHALRRTIDTQLGHSHCGLIDWTIGVGIPGLVLWLGFVGWAIGLGFKRYFTRQDPLGLVLIFVGGGFLGRMLLDSINRDHMLMVFFMVLSILVVMPEQSEQR